MQRPTGPIFVVLRRRGPAWDRTVDMRAQHAWAEHAAFMNRLAHDGVIVLGGPFGDGERTLLVFEAPSETAVRAALAPDPWTAMGLLEIESVTPWTILLARDNGD
jgi:uncharacterized protein YciI